MSEVFVFFAMFVLIAAAVGAMIGWSKFLEWRAERVNHSQVVMSRAALSDYADEQTDRADRPSVSADNLDVPRLQLDRTKAAIIEVLVYNGWQVGDIRAALKGDNGAIGAEVDAARKKLGILPQERTLRVKDIHGERVIPF